MAIMALNIFLAFKPAILPRTYTIRLNKIHKWVGRTAVLFALAHVGIFLGVYVHRGVLVRIFRFRNLLGASTIICLLVLFFSSLPQIRRRWYRIFYRLHVVAIIWSCVALIFHAHPRAYFMALLPLGLLLVHIVARLLFSKTARVEVEHITPTLDLVKVDRSALPADFSLGAHLRISPPLLSFAAWTNATHPYTIASLPEDKIIQLVVRRTNFTMNSGFYSIFGPFNVPFDTSDFKKVLIIAGGAGISIAAPILRSANVDMTDSKLVWVTRSAEEMLILDNLQIDSCDVYITKNDIELYEETVQSHFANKEAQTLGPDSFELDDVSLNDEGRPLTKFSKESADKTTSSRVRQFKGRPDWTDSTADFLSGVIADDVCVVACGPSQLALDAKAWALDRGYNFFSEEFFL